MCRYILCGLDQMESIPVLPCNPFEAFLFPQLICPPGLYPCVCHVVCEKSCKKSSNTSRNVVACCVVQPHIITVAGIHIGVQRYADAKTPQIYTTSVSRSTSTLQPHLVPGPSPECIPSQPKPMHSSLPSSMFKTTMSGHALQSGR